MDYWIYLWLGLVIVFGILEAVTLSLTSVWMAFGALLAMIAATLHWHLGVQIGIFFAASIVLLIATRPLAKRYKLLKTERTNYDRIIGQYARVMEPISNAENRGQIQVMGQVWSARTENGDPANPGDTVLVLRIEGVTAIVTQQEAVK